jgi:hypothetical protein
VISVFRYYNKLPDQRFSINFPPIDLLESQRVLVLFRIIFKKGNAYKGRPKMKKCSSRRPWIRDEFRVQPTAEIASLSLPFSTKKEKKNTFRCNFPAARLDLPLLCSTRTSQTNFQVEITFFFSYPPFIPFFRAGCLNLFRPYGPTSLPAIVQFFISSHRVNWEGGGKLIKKKTNATFPKKGPQMMFPSNRPARRIFLNNFLNKIYPVRA